MAGESSPFTAVPLLGKADHGCDCRVSAPSTPAPQAPLPGNPHRSADPGRLLPIDAAFLTLPGTLRQADRPAMIAAAPSERPLFRRLGHLRF